MYLSAGESLHLLRLTQPEAMAIIQHTPFYLPALLLCRGEHHAMAYEVLLLLPPGLATQTRRQSHQYLSIVHYKR